MTEGCSKGFRNQVRDNWETATEDHMKVFLLMSELGNYQVESAPETMLSEKRNTFSKVKSQLS